MKQRYYFFDVDNFNENDEKKFIPGSFLSEQKPEYFFHF